jgi:hypothetical protein
MLLKGARKTAAKSAPPSLPEPVVQLASQTEAEAMPTAPVSRQAVSRQPPAKTAARSQPHTGHTTRKQH